MGWVHRPAHWVFGKVTGYGHRPWRPFWLGLVVIAIGWAVFWLGFQTPGVMASTKDTPAHAKPNAIIYSIDLFVPVIDLRQATLWQPDPDKKGTVTIQRLKSNPTVPVSGRCLRWWMWFHIAAGWVLTTLFVVGLTGLIRS
jgi:hypothetical protein